MTKNIERFLPMNAPQKMGICLYIITGIFVSSIVLSGQGLCADSPEKTDMVKIKNILIDKVKKEVRINAQVAIREGILEYLLVSEPGKTYESVFKVKENVPSELNFALLLIGCKPLRFDAFMKLNQEEDGRAKLLKDHRESLVELDFYRNGKKVSWDHLMKKREGKAPSLTWVHTGGLFIRDNKYAGDFELSHIGIWPDVTAVINLFSDMGNPYRGGFGLEMNKDNKALLVDQYFEIVIRRKSDEK